MNIICSLTKAVAVFGVNVLFVISIGYVYFVWAAAGREVAVQYVQCRGSASRARRQSASEGIYWFCHSKWNDAPVNFKTTWLKITWMTVMCILLQTLTWWWRRNTGPGVSRRSSGPCRSDPSPWPLPDPPPPAVGLTRLRHENRNRQLWNTWKVNVEIFKWPLVLRFV